MTDKIGQQSILLTSNFVKYTDKISDSTRYIRFFYDVKIAGSNIALDQVQITSSPTGPEANFSIIEL